jgi:hypothetical protein
MKTRCWIALMLISHCCSEVIAQESSWGKWTFQPHLSLGKLLPGSTIDVSSSDFISVTDPAFIPGKSQYQYAAATVGFGFRASPEETPWLGVVLGGGICWFYRPDIPRPYGIAPTMEQGVGAQIAPSDFTVYPLTLGLQVMYPSRSARDFMLFVGAEGTANFVSGKLPMDQSVKVGFGLTAGFAVKVFELGMRYQTFSDLRNLGVYLAFRLNPFEIDFSGGG